jgi:hypothetical protein
VSQHIFPDDISVIFFSKTFLAAFLDVDYNYVGKVQYICAQNDITIVNTEYADGVTFELMMENAARNVLEKNMTEMSSGKICLRDICSMQMYRDDTGKLCR